MMVVMTIEYLGGQYGHGEERHPRPPEALLHRCQDGHRDWADYGWHWATFLFWKTTLTFCFVECLKVGQQHLGDSQGESHRQSIDG